MGQVLCSVQESPSTNSIAMKRAPSCSPISKICAMWGMIESRGGLRLANETLHAIVIRSNIGSQNLQRDSAIKLRILRKIHLTHPAGADAGEDFVMTKPSARVDRHFFKPAVQFCITVKGRVEASSRGRITRNRWPAELTS